MAGATLKVGASNTEFNKAMRDMVQQMKSVKSEFTLASTQAKLFGTETDSLKAKQTQLASTLKIQNDMLKNQENQLKTLAQNSDNLKTKQSELASKITEVANKYKESVAQTGKNSEESKKLKDELDKLKESYAKNDKAIESNNSKLENSKIKMNSTKTAILENEKALSEVEKKLSTIKIEELGNKMQGVSDKTGAVASKLTPVATVITGIGIASAKASVDFETSMAKVFTIADETEVSYDDMKKAIMDLSNQTGVSSNEIADNVYEAISAGQSTGDAVNFVTNATKLAKAGFTDSASALDVLTTIMNSYGLEASEVSNVSDKLIQTQNLGKVTVNELSADMGKLIPTAKSVGANLDQVGTGYALMTSKGIKSAEATTYMNSMMNELGKSGTIASDALKKMSGSTFQELLAKGMSLGDILGLMDTKAKESGKSLADMFGSAEASKAGMILSTNSGKDFNEMLEQMANSAGSTEAAFNKMDATKGQQMAKSFNELKNAGINLGDTLAPIISQVAGLFSDVTKYLSSLNQEQLQTIAKIGLSIVAFTGLMKAISIVSGGISTLINVGKGVSSAFTFISEIKTLGLATKLPALASGLNLLKNGLTTIMTVVRPLITTVVGFFAANPIVLGIVATIAVIALLYSKCEWFRNGVNAIGLWLKNFFTVTLPQAFNTVVNFFQNNWKEILLFIVNPFAGAFALLYKNNETFRQKTNEFILAIKNFFINGWNSIVNFFTVSIPTWINNVVQWFTELPNKIMYGLGLLVGMLATWGVSVWNYFSTNVPMWINNVTTFFSQLPGNIWNFLVDIVTKLGQWGTDVLTYITTNVPVWINNVVTFFSQLPNQIWTWLVNVITDLGTWGGNVVSWISTNVSVWITNIVNYFSQLPNQIWTWLVNCVTNITTWGSNMLTEATGGMQKVFDGVVDTFVNLPSKMAEIGGNIVAGIRQGISDAWNSMTGWIGGLCESFTQGVKDKFEIHSPSHIFRDEVGAMLAQGIGVGFEQEMPQINTNISKTLNGTISIANLDNLKSVDRAYSNSSKESANNTIIGKILDKMDTLAESFNNISVNLDGTKVGKVITPTVSNNLAFNKGRKGW